MSPPFLKPFWLYYGGKWRAAPYYPQPKYGTIIEPFAGAAGYSLRHYKRNVVLVEKYPVIAEMWRYLIRVTGFEIRRIPYVTHVDDLPGWVPDGGRALVGFAMNSAVTAPRKTLSARNAGWCESLRERVATQVSLIRHWVVYEDDYSTVDSIGPATWFIDPPYQAAGKYYIHNGSTIDFESLGSWCKTRRGQIIVCENDGAQWLPFRHFRDIRASHCPSSEFRSSPGVSSEAIWLEDNP